MLAFDMYFEKGGQKSLGLMSDTLVAGREADPASDYIGTRQCWDTGERKRIVTVIPGDSVSAWSLQEVTRNVPRAPGERCRLSASIVLYTTKFTLMCMFSSMVGLKIPLAL